MASPEYSNPVNDWDDQTSVEANAWVAEFAPLVMDDAALDAAQLKERIQRVDKLKSEATSLQERLNSLTSRVDPELAGTFRKASSQLDSLESDFRKRLAKLAPGDPMGTPDLEVVQEKLAEREARQELGVATDQEVPAVLEMKTSPGNWAAAGFIGVFGLGWTSFTTLHAVFMIGGMMKAFGPIALALLLFYAIFFMVGFGMLAAAFAAASTESISLEGRSLTITRKLGAIVRSKTRALLPGSKATVGVPSVQGVRQSGSSPTQAVLLTDEQGSEIAIGSQSTSSQRELLCKRINDYLAAQD